MKIITKQLIRFIASIIRHWLILVAGGVVGTLYYTFISPHPYIADYKDTLDVLIPLIFLIVAVFLSWKALDDENFKLTHELANIKSSKPLYEMEIASADSFFENELLIIEEEINYAYGQYDDAPKASYLFPLPSSIPLIDSPSNVQWSQYIDELEQYKNEIKNIMNSADVKFINFKLLLTGAADENIYIKISFVNFEQVPDFYNNKYELNKPSRPGLFITSDSDFNKLGVNREIHKNSKNVVEVELNKLREGEAVILNTYPIALRHKSIVNLEVEYEIKSTKNKAIKGRASIG